MKAKIWLILLSTVLLALVAACEGGKNVGTPPAASPTPAAVPTGSPTLSNQREIGELLLTLNGVQEYSEDLFPAEAGTHYVAVDITGRNIGDGTYSLNALNFRLKDSDKFTSQIATVSGPQPLIGHHELVPGQEVRGYLVFKLGDGRVPTELQYQSFSGTPGTIPIQ